MQLTLIIHPVVNWILNNNVNETNHVTDYVKSSTFQYWLVDCYAAYFLDSKFYI